MNLKLFKNGFKVNSKGRIDFTKEQWDAFCEYLHCDHFSHRYQKQLIKAWVNGAIEVGIKSSKKRK